MSIDHKIIGTIARLKLYALEKPWRILVTFGLLIWLFFAIFIPGVLIVIPLLFLFFTWFPPTKKNVKKAVQWRKKVFYKMQSWCGMYRACADHLKKRGRRKVKGKK